MGRLTWRRATVVGVHDETATARTLTLEVGDWTGHRAGQHVDVRLTAPDGYTAVRPYSIATPADGAHLDLTVALVEGGEVSPYLVSGAEVGTELEVRGPLGGWFVWDAGAGVPVQLVGGGVGVAPLLAMLRAHDRAADRHPMRLLYATRGPDTVLYAAELRAHDAVTVVHTRKPADDSARPPGRITVADLAAYALPPLPGTRCYVCGSTGFVESTIGLLLDAGFDADDIRAERFG